MEMNYLNILLYLLMSIIVHDKKRMVLSMCPLNLTQLCVRKCQVLDSGELDIDCSTASLPSMIRGLRTTNMPINLLTMHGNKTFTELPEKVFETLTIRQLDLSSNKINRISPKAFLGQEMSLTSLNLSSNDLDLLPDVSMLKALEILDISNNVKLIGKIHESDLVKNSHLKIISLDDKSLLLNNLSTMKASSSGLQTTSGAATPMGHNAVAAMDQMPTISRPVNTFVSTNLMSEFLRNLPLLFGGLSLNNLQQQPLSSIMSALSAQQVSTALTNLDLSKMSPKTIDTTSKNVEAWKSIQVDSKSTPNPDISKILQSLLSPDVPLPPINSLPPNLVSKVMNGELIPGLNASQTDQIKRRYMEMLFRGGQASSFPTSFSKTNLNASSFLQQKIESKNNLQMVTPIDVYLSTTAVLNNSHEWPSRKLIDHLSQQDVNLFEVIQRTNSGSFSIDDLDTKANIDDHLSSNINNVGLYTGLGLGFAGLISAILMVYYCIKLKLHKLAAKANTKDDQAEGRTTLGGHTNKTLYHNSPNRSSKPCPIFQSPYKNPTLSMSHVIPNTIDDLSFALTFDGDDKNKNNNMGQKISNSCSKKRIDEHQQLSYDVEQESKVQASTPRHRGSFIAKTLSYFSESFGLSGGVKSSLRQRLEGKETESKKITKSRNYHVTLASIHGEKTNKKLSYLNNKFEQSEGSPQLRQSSLNNADIPSISKLKLIDEVSTIKNG